MTAVCKMCDQPFEIRPSRIQMGKGKFCSRSCYRKDIPRSSRLNFADVVAIREAYVPRKVSCRKLADLYGVHWETIWNIISFRSWI